MQKSNDVHFVIFGATGDLTKRKLIPAIYNLFKNKQIADNFLITCIGRREYTTNKFIEELKEFYKKNFKNFEEESWNKVMFKLQYYQGDFNDKKKMSELKDVLKNYEKKNNLKSNRIYYLSTSPEKYQSILDAIKTNHLNDQKSGWKKIVIEKPFGYDLKSAKKLNTKIKKVFSEDQIYRLDHYLGKETLNNFLIFRFANTLFEPVWNNKYIDHVQITVAEDLGIEERGEYYDTSGALRDMVQSHLLQMLTFVTMDCPGVFNTENIRREKINILKKVKISDVVLGQYVGYRDEKGVDKNSKTASFTALKFFINNERWKGVPFYIRTGKKLQKKMALIYIKFKDVRCMTDERLKMNPNELIIQIQPEKHMQLHLNSKKPGLNLEIAKVTMDFCYECIYGNTTPESYEKLISDAIRGDLSLFTSSEEVFASWKIIDKIIKNKPQILKYKQGSWGPKNADELIKKDKNEWYFY